MHALLLCAVGVAATLSVRAQFEALRDQFLEESRTDQQLTTRVAVLALQSQFRLLINGLADADRDVELERTVPSGWLTTLAVVDRQSGTARSVRRGTPAQVRETLAALPWLAKVAVTEVSVTENGQVVVAVPMHGGQCVALGIVGSDQVTQDLTSLTQRSTGPTTVAAGGVALITEQGRVLAGSAKVGTWVQASLEPATEKQLNDLIAGGNASTDLIDTSGTTLLSVQPLLVAPGVRWRVVSVHSHVSEAISRRLQPLFLQLLSLSALMLIAVGVVLVSTTVSLTRGRRRIEKLRTDMLNRDLEKARRIQLNWLPSPQLDGGYLSIAAENNPALHISGDFYNWFELPRDEDDRGHKTVVVIGDVSGHGLPAAFLMATTQMAVRNTMPRVRDPGLCLAEINRQLCTLVYNGQFVTMMILVIDHDNAGLEIASAGHHAPLLKRDGQVEQLEIEPQLVVGVDDSVEYQTQRFRTRPGDTFLLYTDGAIEMTDASGAQFRVDRLAAAFAAAPEGPSGALAAISQVLKDYHGTRDAEDDLTLLTAQIAHTDVREPETMGKPMATSS